MKEKVMPHNLEAEQSVIGAMLISKYAVQKSVENLTNDLFYLDAHDKIFSTIRDLMDKNVPIDITTVTSELDNKILLNT